MSVRCDSVGWPSGVHVKWVVPMVKVVPFFSISPKIIIWFLLLNVAASRGSLRRDGVWRAPIVLRSWVRNSVAGEYRDSHRLGRMFGRMQRHGDKEVGATADGFGHSRYIPFVQLLDARDVRLPVRKKTYRLARRASSIQH